MTAYKAYWFGIVLLNALMAIKPDAHFTEWMKSLNCLIAAGALFFAL